MFPLFKILRIPAENEPGDCCPIAPHAANDTNRPAAETEQVLTSLKQRGVPVQYVLFPDEGHGWRKVPNRIRSTVEITLWFVKYLGEPKQDAAN